MMDRIRSPLLSANHRRCSAVVTLLLLTLALLCHTGWAAAATDKMAKESSSALSASSDNWLPREGGGDDDDNPALKPQLQPTQPTIGGGGVATVTADYSSDFEMTPSEVRVAAGTSAYLSCRPRSLRNKTVSWVRHRDVHILTVGRYTYTKDGRFSVYHQRHTGEWTLQLRSAQPKDSGLYECQIGTQPTRSFFVHLQVVEPTTSIFGGPDIHVHEGSPVNLSCVVSQAVGQPEFFFWYHNGQVVEFGVGDRIEKREYYAETDVTVSSLLIKSAHVSHSGNYTCQPAHCPPVSAKVYILKGEQPAAMQRSGGALMMNAEGQRCAQMILVAGATCYSSYLVGGLLNLKRSLFLLFIVSLLNTLNVVSIGY